MRVLKCSKTLSASLTRQKNVSMIIEKQLKKIKKKRLKILRLFVTKKLYTNRTLNSWYLKTP